MWKRHVQYPLFFVGFYWNFNFLNRFAKKYKYQILSKFVQWESTDGRTNGHNEANGCFKSAIFKPLSAEEPLNNYWYPRETPAHENEKKKIYE